MHTQYILAGKLFFSSKYLLKESPALKFSSSLSAKDRLLLPWKQCMALLPFLPPTRASALTGDSSASSQEMPAWGGSMGERTTCLFDLVLTL